MQFLADNWYYILLAGLMIFMMTRGGGCCGGHAHEAQSGGGHSHGGGCCGGGSLNNHGDENREETNQLNSARDPICGMAVDPSTAISETINGQTYYFCSESCRKEFIRNQK
jgi:YHS domain-containing protein